MKIMNFIEVPSTMEEDLNKEHSTWIDDKYVMLDEGPSVTVYLGHQKEETVVYDTNETGHTVVRTVTKAFPIRIQKPLERGKVINAAEMEAYHLKTPMDVASFTASMARKFRENPEDREVTGHDEFIRWIKNELDRSGLFPKSTKDNTGIPVTYAYSFIRAVIQQSGFQDKEAVSLKKFYPEWTAGIHVNKDERYRHEGKLYKVVQGHNTQTGWEPSLSTSALWSVADEDNHSGDRSDPIPYEQNMELVLDKYYTQYGILYRCHQNMSPLPYDLKDIPAHVIPA